MDTILVADVPSMDGRYAAALAGWPLAFARTMPEAHAMLERQRCSLVVIGVYFDDSRMFDLVRFIRNDDIHNEAPIVCVRGSPGFTAVTTRTLEMAVKALSADAFVDLLHFDDERAADAKAPPAVVVAAIRAAVQQLKWQQLRYGPVDPAVWGLMNRVFVIAEARGIAEAKTEYMKAVMFSAASPETRPAAELELAERVIAELAPSFAMANAPAPGLPYWIDLAQAMAPARSSRAPQASAGSRYFGPGAALGTLQNLSERLLAKREIPSELKPVPGDDPDTVLGVLRHLAMYWAHAAPERKHKRHNVQSKLTIAHGFDGVVEALGGNPDDSLNFGARVAGEQWVVDNVSASGFGAIAPQARSEWVKVGALVAAQPDGAANWMVGTVRRVSKVSKDEMRIGVETLSRTPAVWQFALRNAQRAAGVLLPPVAPSAGDSAIALRAGIYSRGENLESNVGGKHHVYMPQGVSERGEDYEIVRFKELVRES